MGQSKFKVNMGRLVALIMTIALVLSCAPLAFADGESGTCGDNLTWSLSAGTLTISGSGAMANYPESVKAPWYPCRAEITKIVLPDGMTSIGDLAFYDCSNLVSVVIPDSVASIGSYAFAKCTNMEFMTMGSGVKNIGSGAFEECEKLTSVRLPEGLKSIGFRGFYRCYALTSITIPSTATELGMTVFGYCTGLVQATIHAQIQEIPEWFFYGCESLTSVVLNPTITSADTYAFRECDRLLTVNYSGSEEDAKNIKDDIVRDEPNFSGKGTVSDNEPQEQTTVTKAEDKGDTVVLESTTTVETGNATVGSTTREEHSTETGDSTTSTTINATVENQDGWKDVADQVQDALDYQEEKSELGMTTDKIDVTIYIKDETQLTQDVLDAYAGKDVNLTVRTESGSSWVIDCSTLESPADREEGKKEKEPAKYDLSYELSPASEKIMEELGGSSAYTLKFNSSAKINAQFVIQLPNYHARQNAYLYQRVGGKLERLQGAMVDSIGLANFYLASVDEKTEYVIGINVPGEDTSDVVIPQSLAAEYGVLQDFEQRQYTITGRESSWGMNINQVTWIMIGGMTAVVVTVGFVMYLLNKRKLRMGYVPDLDEEFE